MNGHDAEAVIGGWLLDHNIRLLIDVRQHGFFIPVHIDFIVVRGNGIPYFCECKCDAKIKSTHNFVFETARIYIANGNDYSAWGYHSKADKIMIYSPLDNQILEIKSLPTFRKWLTPEKIILSSPVVSANEHKGVCGKKWDKVTYNWLIKSDELVKANQGRWHKLDKPYNYYQETFAHSEKRISFSAGRLDLTKV